jgi:two-component system chemotaxis response regulator CheY
MKALVVDDSRTMRTILAKILRGLDMEVSEAENGEAALAALADEPELVLVDWNMPVMSGIDFVVAARGAEYAYRGRIMLVTAETDADQVVQALDAGADEYLMKPFDPEAVVEKLRLLDVIP